MKGGGGKTSGFLLVLLLTKLGRKQVVCQAIKYAKFTVALLCVLCGCF
jgi:hypothetical protein